MSLFFGLDRLFGNEMTMLPFACSLGALSEELGKEEKKNVNIDHRLWQNGLVFYPMRKPTAHAPHSSPGTVFASDRLSM